MFRAGTGNALRLYFLPLCGESVLARACLLGFLGTGAYRYILRGLPSLAGKHLCEGDAETIAIFTVMLYICNVKLTINL